MAKFVPQAEMPLSDQVKVRREKLEALRAEGLDPFVQTKFEVTSSAREIKENFDALEGKTVTLAGRLMSKRGMGKVSFSSMCALTPWRKRTSSASRKTTSATSLV